MTSLKEKNNGYLIDWITQQWVKSSRKRISLANEKWLDGLTGKPEIIGNNFFEDFAARNNLIIDSTEKVNGLVENFSDLNSTSFQTEKVHPRIVEFYERTSSFEFDIWSEWSALAKPFGWLISKIFSQRLQQLNLPVSSLDSSRGITSRILNIKTKGNHQVQYVGWLRKVVKTGNVIYAGAYTSCIPPNLNFECVKVIFPLPNGNATVILWPENIEDGSLKLHSSGNKFGDGGFYLLVHSGNGYAHVKYVKSIKETIHVYIDNYGELRTDHKFKYLGMIFLRLHYRIRNK